MNGGLLKGIGIHIVANVIVMVTATIVMNTVGNKIIDRIENGKIVKTYKG